MLTLSSLAADALGTFLAGDFARTFGATEPRLAQGLETAARLAMEAIGISDALYHNLEHTMLVTLVGRDIIRGRYLLERTTPSDWVHLLIACLSHDIGYVRGLLKADRPQAYVVAADGRTVSLPRGASDASLEPYHVDRSKLFVLERFGNSDLIDADRINRAIEFTRFPVPAATEEEVFAETNGMAEEPLLVRAADFIGQLGDPSYLRKAHALFSEFRETGMDRQLNYQSAADLTERYPDFFWRSVSPKVDLAMRYLNVTAEGRSWIAHLHSNVFAAEHGAALFAHFCGQSKEPADKGGESTG
jgi:hypothetical protein